MTFTYPGLGELQEAEQSLETMRRLAPETASRSLRGDTRIAQPTRREQCTTSIRFAAGLKDPSAAHAYR